MRRRFLAEGYVNNPKLTAERFLPQANGTVLFKTGDRGSFREDGCLLFLRRVDSLVKIRGYRVEPEAVEAALAHHEGVSHCAVIVDEAVPGEPRLAAYVVPHGGATVTVEQLRDHLARALPAYSVPSSIRLIEALPVTRNGKIDRSALAAAERSDGSWERALPAVRIATSSLIGIWRDVLERREIGPADNFFDCGGDSLNALRLQMQLHASLGVDVPLDVIVRHPTPERLSAWLDGVRDADEVGRTLIALQPA